MQITRANFQESYEKFRDIVNSPKTDFVSYDFEMSGIRTTEKESYNDLPFERYEKCSQVGRKYSLIQAGISIFHKEGDQYICYPFNAYVIRRKVEGTSYKSDIVLESGAIRFNAEHGLDFDFWIKNGISFLDREQYKNLIQETNKKHGISDQERKVILKNIEDSLGFTKFFELVGQRNVPVVGHNCYMDLMFFHNSFIGNLPKFYSNKLSIDDENEEQKEQNEEVEDKNDALENGDKSRNTFKENIHSLFMQMYDSKTISVSFFKEFMHEENKSTSLESLKDCIYSDLARYRLANVKLADGYQDYDWDIPSNTQKFHEAGFDSYLTGWTFLQLRQFYMTTLNKTLQDFENTYLNRINIMNNRFFLTMGQDEDIPQTQILNNIVSDDIFQIFTHQDHNDPSKDFDFDAMEKLQKKILEHFINQQYSQFVRVGIQNQRYIFIELSLQNNKDQVNIDGLKKKIESDFEVVSKMANPITLKEYEQQVFHRKYTKNNNNKKPYNNNNSNNNSNNNNNSKVGNNNNNNNNKFQKKKY